MQPADKLSDDCRHMLQGSLPVWRCLPNDLSCPIWSHPRSSFAATATFHSQAEGVERDPKHKRDGLRQRNRYKVGTIEEPEFR
jgi:hypothetical protein